jgi:hypothetical protein
LLPTASLLQSSSLFSFLHLRLAVTAALVLACLSVTGCVAPLGPGYLVEKQGIEVHFLPSADAGQPPRIQVQASYNLRNTGNRPLSTLQARLPRSRRVQPSDLKALWDGSPLEMNPSPDTRRNAVLTLPASWRIGARRTLKISYEIASSQQAQRGLRFSNDAFFLPAADWSPEMLPQNGPFGFGGSPPEKWELTVQVPAQFSVHTSGTNRKTSRSRGEQVVRSNQTTADHYPFVVAGRYSATEAGTSGRQIVVWSRSRPAAELAEAGPQLAHAADVYDAAFGRRFKRAATLWVVECPDTRGCFSNPNAMDSLVAGDDSSQEPAAEMISSDTVMVDLSSGVPALAASAAPSLAASWLGYGQNPGFYEQVPPLSALPTFAAALAREAVEGPAYRTQVIRRALSRIPPNAETLSTHGKRPEEPTAVVRAKSFLFFYGLQDRYGADVFQKATTAMLDARRGRGFEISDLIASFDQESGKYNTAEFVRLWMKHPGVPEEFRARYQSTAPAGNGAKETLP